MLVLVLISAAVLLVGLFLAVVAGTASTAQAGRVLAIIGAIGLLVWLVLDLANGHAGLIG